jgi:hypothetical protein
VMVAAAAAAAAAVEEAGMIAVGGAVAAVAVVSNVAVAAVPEVASGCFASAVAADFHVEALAMLAEGQRPSRMQTARPTWPLYVFTSKSQDILRNSSALLNSSLYRSSLWG